MAELNTERLRRATLVYSALALVGISLVVAAVSIVPLTIRLREATHAGLRHAVELKAMAAEEFLSRAVMLAQQVTSRSVIRNKLAAYEHGQITLTELADFTSDKLVDSLNLSAELDGIVRLGAKGEIVVAVGQAFPWQTQAVQASSIKRPTMSQPIMIDGTPRIVVSAPIVDHAGERLGTDLVLVDARRLVQILHDSASLGETGDIAIFRSGESPTMLIPFRNASALPPNRLAQIISRAVARGQEPVVDAAADPILVAAGIDGLDWIMLMRMDAHEANASVDQLVLAVTLATALLTIAGVLGLVLVLRPLTGGIIVHANDMRRQIEELERGKIALTQSNADLEQFAYVSSHDLQTPLRNMVRYSQLLERRYKGQLDSEADTFIRYIVDGGKRMALLITALLDYSHIFSESRPLQPTSAKEAVAQALARFNSELNKIGAEVSVGELPQVIAEPSQLVSLFQNLLGNSIKYRAAETPLRLSVTAEKIGEDQWRFAVTDNGIGIEPQYHEKIFQIFQRLNPLSETEGTGIGLTMCRRIVHRFGGTIWVESTPGLRTTFFFTLSDGNRRSTPRPV